jgi:hypothetical protein
LLHSARYGAVAVVGEMRVLSGECRIAVATSDWLSRAAQSPASGFDVASVNRSSCR